MDKKFQFRDITGFYTDDGSGSVIMLIHGFCEDGSVWDGFSKKLIDKYRVIVPDLSGYRNSSLTKEPLTIEWMADFVHAVLEKEEIANPILIGHSMGGYITLALTEKHPALPQKIGLFHSHAFSDDDEKKKARQKGIDFITKNGTRDFVNELYHNLFGQKFLIESKSEVDRLKAQSQSYPPETIIAGLSAMIQRPDRAHVLKSFKLPVLFILGKEDKAIPYDKSLEQCRYPEISQVAVLDGVGHMGMLEAPGKTLEIIREFANL